MNTIPSHIKQLDEIRQLLTQRSIDHAEIVSRVRSVFREVGYRRYPYEFRFSAVYRAAAKDSEAWFNKPNGQPDISKLGCPDDATAKSVGRCNMAYDPVFYCSTDGGVPIFEVRSSLNQAVVVSTWVNIRNSTHQFKHPITTKAIAVGVINLVDSMTEENPNRALLLQDDIYKASTPQAIKDVDLYVGKLFCEPVGDEDKSLYMFTSAIAFVLLNDLKTPTTGEALHALLYPSVESGFSGQNIALHKNFARQQLKLYGAALYRVVEHDPTHSRYSLKPTKGLGNDPTDHSPIWRNIHPKHDAARYYLSPETQTSPYNPNTHLSFEND